MYNVITGFKHVKHNIFEEIKQETKNKKKLDSTFQECLVIFVL